MTCGEVTKAKKKKVDKSLEFSSAEQVFTKYANILRRLCENKTCFPKPKKSLVNDDNDSSTKKKLSSGDDLSVPGHHVEQRHNYVDDKKLLFCCILVGVVFSWHFSQDIRWEKVLKEMEQHLEEYTGSTPQIAKHIMKSMRAFISQR
jgi:hypothetical protein